MLDSYGWSDSLQHAFQPYAAQGLTPGRVIVQQRGLYRLATPLGDLAAELSGRFVHDAAAGGHPVAGDFVACAARPGEGAATIHHLLPRSGAFTRRAAGGAGGVGQVVAANVDVAFLAASLNADLNLRRIERYLALTYESGASPVVVLTKADLSDAADEARAEVEAVAFGVPVLAVSALTGEGLEDLAACLPAGRTAVLLGSSGVGKSTLVNALAGEDRMAVQAIREHDARGRHTTSHRELVLLPSGGLLLDTPGMRELGLWDADAGVAQTFADVEALAEGCRFSDCRHGAEPGCAVQAAVAAGELDAGRLASFGKLQRELAYVERKEDPRAQAASRKVWISRTKALRAHLKSREIDG